MSFLFSDSLKIYSFELFQEQPLIQGVFTRKGGISPEPWASLNLGGTVGDPRENVIENRRRIFQAVERPVESIFDVWQVHGNRVVSTDRTRPLDAPHEQADAILTNRPEITLMMRFADCVPVLFYDPEHAVVGIAHAGWRGTVNKIVTETVAQMKRDYGSNPKNILAGIGPSIGPDHYEVGEEVIRAVEQGFHKQSADLLHQVGGHTHLDLWNANRLALEEAGVEKIQIAGVCTACHTEDWFSHRGEKGRTGRFGAVICLR